MKQEQPSKNHLSDHPTDIPNSFQAFANPTYNQQKE